MNTYNNKITKEVITVKGICSNLLSMETPTIREMNKMLYSMGYRVIKLKPNNYVKNN